jgi:CRISPR system Cascade subunit CasE
MTIEFRPLHMVRLALDGTRLFAIGRARRLPPHRVDVGYLVHCTLADLFGRDTLQPFWVSDCRGRDLAVLAYTHRTESELREEATSYGDPAAYAACDWDQLALKPLPVSWEVGRRLGFEVRICPVLRMAADGAKHRKGAEVDAFLARCWGEGAGTSVDREEVYRAWVGEHLERQGGARIVESSLQRFQLARLLRRTQGDDRKAVFCERPDATLGGVLEVTDGERFGALLAGGIGRHKAFGFGMLRLRPLRS